MTDTKRLRELAEAVLSSKPDFCGGDWRTHYDYEKAANPQAIIALIDELEKTKAQLAEANWVLRFYGCVDSYFDGSAGLENSAIEDDMGAQANQYLEKWKVGK